MEDRTRAYLRGRFRDHYRRNSVDLPPEPQRREWGYIPFSSGGTTMIRHLSELEIGDVNTFLTERRPRHVYFSAGYYENPGVDTMDAKGWRGSDLVFDLDADHLPDVDPETTGYAAMLDACKDALLRLLEFLEMDFGFDDLTIVFSGGRGYHVHVRDPAVRSLDREDRREIVEYIWGADVDFNRIHRTETVDGTAGRKSPAEKRVLRTEGGWGRRVHRRLCEYIDRLQTLDDKQAMMDLTNYDGIGEGSATAILTAIEENERALRTGNLDVHQAVLTLVKQLVEETVAAERAPIDEPVTTDIRRLIRVPDSLHGGTGLQVQRISRETLPRFDPLTDAVPETFHNQDITVEVRDLSAYKPLDDSTVGKIELGGDTFTVTEGTGTYPEYLGIFLMARGDAEKGKE